VQDNHPAASAARELKAAARDALRMGSQWAHTALQWVDDRSQDMNNRNRGPGQNERAQSDRHSVSGYGTGENESDSSYGAERYRSTPHLSGGRQGERTDADRDIQSRYASGRYAQHNQGREGSYPQSMSTSPEDYSDRGDYVGFGPSQRSERSNPSSWVGRENERDMARAGRSNRGYDRGYAGNREFDDQDFSQSYSQGSSHYGSQGFGAQGSQGVYGPQGLGAQGGIGARDTYGADYGASGQGASGSGGYSQEGYGTASGWREQSRDGGGSWHARDVTGHGFGERGYGEQAYGERGTSSGRSLGTRSGGYRGLGPKNYTRSDERIRDDLNERLTDSDEIDASGISVDVNSGVATLTGTVEQRWMKHRAEDLAEACSGVRDVNNQIRVTNASQGSSTMGASTAQGTGRASASTSPGGGASGLGHAGGGGSTSSSTGASSTTATPGLSPSAGGTTGSSGSGSTGGSSANRPSGSSGSTVA
jgi:osmotically-inducible protein OsmY